ncbi:MAG: L,D-transpeptidase [Actinomycetes bacterium]
MSPAPPVVDRRRSVALAVLAAVAAAAWLGGGPTVGTAAATSAAPHEAVELLEDFYALKHPSARAARIKRLEALTPANADQLRVPIRERKQIGDQTWLRVMLPGRPNNRTGWIRYDEEAMTIFKLKRTIRIDVGSRVLVASENGLMKKRVRVVVGARSTPTPYGEFFVMEKVQGMRWSKRGWALALSAYSNVLMRFDGGEGQVAIHARGSLAGSLGSASSHGCIRVDDGVAAWLTRFAPNGTFVQIVP